MACSSTITSPANQATYTTGTACSNSITLLLRRSLLYQAFSGLSFATNCATTITLSRTTPPGSRFRTWRFSHRRYVYRAFQSIEDVPHSTRPKQAAPDSDEVAAFQHQSHEVSVRYCKFLERIVKHTKVYRKQVLHIPLNEIVDFYNTFPGHKQDIAGENLDSVSDSVRK